MEQANQTDESVHRVKRGRPPKVAAVELPKADDKAHAYALRVWAGQSPDVPRAERMARVVAALQAQGLDTNVEMPE